MVINTLAQADSMRSEKRLALPLQEAPLTVLTRNSSASNLIIIHPNGPLALVAGVEEELIELLEQICHSREQLVAMCKSPHQLHSQSVTQQLRKGPLPTHANYPIIRNLQKIGA